MRTKKNRGYEKIYSINRYTVLVGCHYVEGATGKKPRNNLVFPKGIGIYGKGRYQYRRNAPVPLPREIRAIDSYRPTLCVSIEGDIKKWFGESRNGV